MSYFEYLKYNNYITYNEQIILNKEIYTNNSYNYKLKKPVNLIKLYIPELLIGNYLLLYGESKIKIHITKQKIEILKNNNFYFENLKSIYVINSENNKKPLINLPIINITYTFKDIQMSSMFISEAYDMDIFNYVESVHIITNIIKNDTNLKSIYIDQKDNNAVYKFKLDNFKIDDCDLLINIDNYLKKYTLKKLYFYVIYKTV